MGFSLTYTNFLKIFTGIIALAVSAFKTKLANIF